MRTKLLIAAVFLVGASSVAYAAFSQLLTVNGTGNVTGNWDVEIKTITRTDSNPGATNHSGVAPSVAPDGLTADFNVDLAYPGSSATYDVVYENKGNIPAKVTTVPDLTTTNAADPTDVTYAVTGIALNDTIAPAGTLTATVTVTWAGGATSNVTTASKAAAVTYDFSQNTP